MTESDIRKEIKRCDQQLTFLYIIMPSLIFSLFVYADIVDDKIKWFELAANSLDSYMSVTAEILSAIIGLAIPIALNVVQMIQSKNKTTKLTRDFISEHVYKAQIVLLLANITVIVLMALFNWPYMWIFCVALFIASMIYLVLFIRLIHRYVADLETYLAEKYHEEIESYFK